MASVTSVTVGTGNNQINDKDGFAVPTNFSRKNSTSNFKVSSFEINCNGPDSDMMNTSQDNGKK